MRRLRVEHDGKVFTVKDLCRLTKIKNPSVIQARLKMYLLGKTTWEDMTRVGTRRQKRRLGPGWGNRTAKFTYNGITDDLNGWAKRLGTSYICLYKRLVIRKQSLKDSLSSGRNQLHKYVTANGETHTLVEWGHITGVDPDRISARLISGGHTNEECVGLEKLIPRCNLRLTWRGRTMSGSEWAKKLGLTYPQMCGRLAQWRKGECPKWCVFRKTHGYSGRIKKSFAHYYKGKAYYAYQLAEMKGTSTDWIKAQLKLGFSVHEIMNHMRPMTPSEVAQHSAECNRRRKRRKELMSLGIMV